MNQAAQQAEALNGFAPQLLQFRDGHGNEGLIGQAFDGLPLVMIPGAAFEEHHRPRRRIYCLGSEPSGIQRHPMDSNRINHLLETPPHPR